MDYRRARLFSRLGPSGEWPLLSWHSPEVSNLKYQTMRRVYELQVHKYGIQGIAIIDDHAWCAVFNELIVLHVKVRPIQHSTRNRNIPHLFDIDSCQN